VAGDGGQRGRLFAALTGNTAADVSGAGDDLRGMLMAVGGPSGKTRSGIDLSRAAAALGVSRRTVERWIRTADTGQGQRPSPSHSHSLAQRARQAATTQDGRRRGLQAVRDRKTLARGARLAITGMQGPKYPGKDYKRLRTTQLDLDPDSAAAMLDAYERGGDKGFLGWVTQMYGEQYVDDWEFGPIDGIEIQSPYGGEWR
jgi:transposase-like protein